MLPASTVIKSGYIFICVDLWL